MKLRKIFIPVTLIISIATLLLSGCGRHHHDPEEKAEYLVHKISKKMDLTESQKAKLEAVKVEFLSHKDEHRVFKKTLMDNLMTEIQKPEMDESVLLELVNHHKIMVDKVSPGVIEKLIDFHASLDDDQKSYLVKKMKKHQSHFLHDEG